MAKYVKTEALLSAFVEVGQASKRYKLGDFWELNGAEIREVMDSMPAADVEEVRHGKNLDAEYSSLFECSVCHWSCWDTLCGDTPTYNYCPNCGAKMDGDEE